MDLEPELQDFDVLGSESLFTSSFKSSTFFWGLIALIIYSVLQRLRTWYRLRHIPGPFWASITGLWLIHRQWRGNLCSDLKEVCDQYGPIVRISPDFVVCADAHELRRIWGGRSSYRRSNWWYRAMRLDPNRECTLSERDDSVHNAMRSKLANGYAGKDIDNLHTLIDEQVEKLVALIDSRHVSTETTFKKMDLAKEMQYFTQDVISSIAFGRPFGYLDADEDMFGYIATCESTIPAIMMTALLPPILMVLQSPLFKPTLPKTEDVVGLGKVMGIAHEVVSQRYGEDKVVKKDMLGSFVSHGLSQDEAEAESLVQIAAGADTTATALRATLLYLMTTPHAYRRLQTEIDEAVRTGQVSSPVITDAESKRLPYLQAVIKEGLRIFPPITGLMPKVSDKDDVVCGKHIPAGTNVAWAAWSVMRDRKVFGDDAEMFQPERWLGVPAEKLKEMEYSQLMCFGTGSRWECLGKSIAYIELNKVFFELLRQFDFTIVRPEEPWKSYNAGIFIQTGLDVRVTRRGAST